MKRGSIPVVVVAMVFTSVAALWWARQAAAEERNPAQRLKGRYSFRMSPVKSFSADAPGDPGGLASAPRQDILRVGVFAADGDGNLHGRTLATTDTNTGDTWLVTYNWAGKYVVNPDGTGFFSIDEISDLVCTQMSAEHSGSTPHPAAADGIPVSGNIPCAEDIEGHEDYAFVFSAHGGKRIEFIQTDNAGGGSKVFLTGTATARESFGKEEREEEDDD